MKFGLYVGSRAGATCAGPADPLRIGPLVDELSGGRPFVIREYVRWCGGNAALEQEIDASHDLDHLTMPDDWYVTGDRELDLVLSYLPPVADLDGWLAFIDRALDRYGHLVRYLQVTLEANFPIPASLGLIRSTGRQSIVDRSSADCRGSCGPGGATRTASVGTVGVASTSTGHNPAPRRRSSHDDHTEDRL